MSDSRAENIDDQVGPARQTRDLAETALGDLRAELPRVDAKAAALLAVSGAALTIELAAVVKVGRIPLLALIAGGITLGCTATAIGLLIWAIRPRLDGDHGLVAWARLDPVTLRAELARSTDPTIRLIWAARLAHNKYRLLDISSWLLLTALTSAVGTALLIAL